jgi:hypothetical protein
LGDAIRDSNSQKLSQSGKPGKLTMAYLNDNKGPILTPKNANSIAPKF